jgi:hypothetical protein
VLLLFHNLYSFKTNVFFSFINLQVEHTLDKCYNEPKNGPASMVFVELYPVVVATLGKTVVREKDTRLL